MQDCDPVEFETGSVDGLIRLALEMVPLLFGRKLELSVCSSSSTLRKSLRGEENLITSLLDSCPC